MSRAGVIPEEAGGQEALDPRLRGGDAGPHGKDVPSVGAAYKARKGELLAEFREVGSTRSVKGLLQALSQLADDTLKLLWQRAGIPAGIALVAVGGFGRGELFPHSDVDVLLLMPDGISPDHDDTLKRRIENFIGSCWDAGLEIGSSVRTVEECVAQAAGDVTVQTALIESRPDHRLAQAVQGVPGPHPGAHRPARLLHGQDAGDAPAPHQVREHALLAGAELQGVARRPARPAGDPVGGQRRPASARAGTSWPGAAWPRPSRRARSSTTRRCCR
jgi:hypothetical protein